MHRTLILAAFLLSSFTAGPTPDGNQKAHLWVSTDGGARRPRILFYSNRNLSGASPLTLDERGVQVNGQMVCGWPDGGSDSSRSRCPSDLPIELSSGSVSIELTRVSGSLVEILFRDVPHYFSLRSLPGDPWSGSSGTFILPPVSSLPLLGGVDVPSAFRPKAGRSATTLHRSPDRNSPVLETFTSARYLESFSLGGSALVANVYGRSNRWSLLRLIDGRTGWLRPEDAGKFVSLERLVTRGDNYLSPDWDRTLARAPGEAARFPVPHDPRRSWIGYLEPLQKPDGTVTVFAAPDRSQPQRVTYDNTDRSALESVLLSSGEYRPIVFSRRPGWLEVALHEEPSIRQDRTRVWMEEAPSQWTLQAVDAVDAELLLTPEWGPEAQPAVEVVETRYVNGHPWLHVRVLVGGACEQMLGELKRAVLAEGWTPAHAPSGRLIVWYETYCD